MAGVCHAVSVPIIAFHTAVAPVTVARGAVHEAPSRACRHAVLHGRVEGRGRAAVEACRQFSFGHAPLQPPEQDRLIFRAATARIVADGGANAW
jgi:hypothetical protein